MRKKNHLSAWAEAREALRAKDAMCPHCAYNLRGNQNGTCPECGQSFDMIAAAFGTVPERGVFAALTGMWSLGIALIMNFVALGFVVYGAKAGPWWIYAACLVALFIVFAAWKYMLGERSEIDRGLTIHTDFVWLIFELIGSVLAKVVPSERWLAAIALSGTAIHCLFGLIVAFG